MSLEAGQSVAGADDAIDAATTVEVVLVVDVGLDGSIVPVGDWANVDDVASDCAEVVLA